MTARATVIVTGASRGLGAATARAAATMGANVVLNARSEDDLRQVAQEIDPSGERVLVRAGDVSLPEDCQRLVQATLERFGRLDALVNNAGVLQPIARITEADPASWRHNIEVNLLGPFYATHFALPHLRQQRGRLLSVSSGAAVKTTEGWSAYATAKAGLNHFNRLLADEEPEIVAIAFRPGVVDTEMQATIREEGGGGMTAESYRRFVAYHEQGELLPPQLPGRALAALALRAPHSWSGEFISWQEERVQALLEKMD